MPAKSRHLLSNRDLVLSIDAHIVALLSHIALITCLVRGLFSFAGFLPRMHAMSNLERILGPIF
ncbi:MAG: hypothetical protein ACI89J_001857 [Hyphomicrobiaceae bacterium]